MPPFDASSTALNPQVISCSSLHSTSIRSNPARKRFKARAQARWPGYFTNDVRPRLILDFTPADKHMNIHSHANPTPLWRVILEAMPLTATLVLVLLWPFDTSTPQPAAAEPIELQVDSAAALEAAFSEIGYLWPPVDPVPRLALQQLPPDLAGLPTSSRKSLFFASLTPLILIENERLQHKRARLKTLLATSSLSDLERQELTTLAERYALADVLDDTQKQQQLLDRIDEIPLGLALAQAAKESGWGTSRFAQD